MKIKICGLFREADADSASEAGVDYAGFVFAESRRRVSRALAERMRTRLAGGIVPVGVFAGASIGEIAALYRDGTIAMAQLHGGESEEYIARLKEETLSGGGALGGAGKGAIPVIKAILARDLRGGAAPSALADYCLVDSGAGSGRPFDWGLLRGRAFPSPWFLAGGICAENIESAMGFGPFGIDVSGGAETGGEKDRGKIMRLAAMARKGKTA